MTPDTVDLLPHSFDWHFTRTLERQKAAMTEWLENRKHTPPRLKLQLETEAMIRIHINSLWSAYGRFVANCLVAHEQAGQNFRDSVPMITKLAKAAGPCVP